MTASALAVLVATAAEIAAGMAYLHSREASCWHESATQHHPRPMGNAACYQKVHAGNDRAAACIIMTLRAVQHAAQVMVGHNGQACLQS